jgi:hypothetical protein
MRFMEQENAGLIFFVHSLLNKIKCVSVQYFVLCRLPWSLEYFQCSAEKEGTVQRIFSLSVV